MNIHNEILKEIRKAGKEVGLTFKREVGILKNGSKDIYYVFTKRRTDEVVLEHSDLFIAYENVLAGYISSWDGEKFVGVSEEVRG